MIRILMVGFGYWGKIQYGTFRKNNGCKVVGIVDKDIGMLREARDSEVLWDNTVSFISDDVDDVVTNYASMFDAVVISTPPHTHSTLINKCLKAGKHVFCEKPLVLNQIDLDEAYLLAEERDRILYCGYNYLHSPCYSAISEMRKDLGDILAINMTRTHFGHIRKDVSPFYDLCVHDVSVLLDNLGKFDIDIKSVEKFGNIEEVDGFFANFEISGRFIGEKPAKCRIYNSWISPKKQRIVEIIGTEGCLYIDENADKEVRLVKYKKDGSNIVEFEPVISARKSLDVQAENFLYSVANIRLFDYNEAKMFDSSILQLLDSLSRFKNH